VKAGDLVYVFFDGRDHMGLVIAIYGHKATVLEADGRLELWDIKDLEYMKQRAEEPGWKNMRAKLKY